MFFVTPGPQHHGIIEKEQSDTGQTKSRGSRHDSSTSTAAAADTEHPGGLPQQQPSSGKESDGQR